jgi:predicted unusual protein kinase regulating ubiquinone biosynthesis (AarF/ABC1/UbiB family)
MKVKKPDLVKIYQADIKTIRLLMQLDKLVFPSEFHSNISEFKEQLNAGHKLLKRVAESLQATQGTNIKA